MAALLGAIPAWTAPASADDYYTYSGRGTVLCVTSAGVIKVKLRTAQQPDPKCGRSEWTYNVVAANFDALGARVQADLEKLQGEFQDKLDSQSEVVTSLDERVTSLESRADALESRASDIESLLADLATQIGDMQRQFSDFQDQMQSSIDSKADLSYVDALAELVTGAVEGLDGKAAVEDLASTNDAVAELASIVDTKAAQADLDAEVDRAVNVEADLQSQIDALSLSLSDEVQRASDAEQALQYALDAEVERATAAEGDLQAQSDELTLAVADEVERATAAEDNLQTQIDEIRDGLLDPICTYLGGCPPEGEPLPDVLSALSAAIDEGAQGAQDALDAAVADLTSQIGDLAGTVDANVQAAQDALDAAVADLTSQIGDVASSVSDLAATVDANAQAGQDALDAAVADVTSQIGELAGTVDANVQAAQDALDAAVADVTSQIGELSGTVDANAQAAQAALDSAVADLTGQIGDVATSVSDLASTVDANAQAAQESLDSAVADLTAGLEETNSTIAGLNDSFVAYQAALSDFLAGFDPASLIDLYKYVHDTVDGAIADIQDQLAATQDDVATQVSELTELVNTTAADVIAMFDSKASNDDLAAEVARASAAEADLATQLGDLSATVEQNAADAASALDAAVSDLQSQIADLPGLLEELANNLDTRATQSQVDELASAVETKANAEDVSVLFETVDTKAEQADLENLSSVVETKASADDVQAFVESVGDFVSVAADMASNDFWQMYATGGAGLQGLVGGRSTGSPSVMDSPDAFATYADLTAAQNSAIVDTATVIGILDAKSLLDAAGQDNLTAALTSLSGIGSQATAVLGNTNGDTVTDLAGLLVRLTGDSGQLDQTLGDCGQETLADCVAQSRRDALESATAITEALDGAVAALQEQIDSKTSLDDFAALSSTVDQTVSNFDEFLTTTFPDVVAQLAEGYAAQAGTADYAETAGQAETAAYAEAAGTSADAQELITAVGDFNSIAADMSADEFWQMYGANMGLARASNAAAVSRNGGSQGPAAVDDTEASYVTYSDITIGQNRAINDIAAAVGIVDLKLLLEQSGQESVSGILGSLAGLGLASAAVTSNSNGGTVTDLEGLLERVGGADGQLDTLLTSCETDTLAECVGNVAQTQKEASQAAQDALDAAVSDLTQQLASVSDVVSGKAEQSSVDEVQSALDAAVADLQGQVDGKASADDLDALGSDVSALTETVTALAETVDGKASAEDLSVLAETVSGLAETVDGKASAEDLSALAETVSGLAETVDGKASAEDLSALAETVSGL
ncbi:MAG: hypothetical protein KGP01_04110, partial [Actinomycetales bacterium]|nr:hypothetical protein [Actinomycetales bacterium]